MPRTLFVENGPAQSHYVDDWNYAGSIANATAAAAMVAAGGAGYRHYISRLVLSSEGTNSMWVGVSGTAGSYAVGKTSIISGGAPAVFSFAPGMELEMPVVNKGIYLISDVSATINYTISGYKALEE